MKTSVIEVRDMLSVLSVLGVEKRIAEVPGVESVTVNYAAGSATVRYDETRLAAADIKAAVHQSGNEPAGETQSEHVSEHKPVVNGREDHSAPGVQPSTPEPAVPKTSTVVPAAVPAPGAPAIGGHQDHAAPGAKPSTPIAAAPKAAALAPADPAPVAKSSTPATAEPKANSWKVRAFSLATTLGVAFISCALFDILFPPFGLLAVLAPASPWPISGSALAFLTGFALFIVAGFVLGALYGITSDLWSRILR